MVIAVTATDVDDKLFTGANRGKYVSVAAPGVDILVPAPENTYQITTGTSVAAAEVSGIVALLLERNPKLTPADIRRILTSSAKRLGAWRPRRKFRLGLSRSAQGTTARYSANRCHDSAADAVVTCGRPVGTANLIGLVAGDRHRVVECSSTPSSRPTMSVSISSPFAAAPINRSTRRKNAPHSVPKLANIP